MTKLTVDNDEGLRHNSRMKVTLPAALLIASYGWGQAAPAFEVVSVGPRGAQERGAFDSDCNTESGRFVSRGPLAPVIQWAWGIKRYQLVGMPEWDPTILYDGAGIYVIEARAAGPVTEAACKQMVQKLFADRFKLASHTETRDSNVYTLVAAKGGPKMKLATDEDKTGNRIVLNGRPMGSAPGASPSFVPPGWSMDMLTDFMGVIDGRPVLNRTNLEGLYRINLDFSLPPRDPNVQLPPEAGPDIRVALEQQMGLRLEPRKAPMTMLIIDHIEKPDAN